MAAKKFTKVEKGATTATSLLPSKQGKQPAGAAPAEAPAEESAAPLDATTLLDSKKDSRPKHPVTGQALYGHQRGDGKTVEEVHAMKVNGTYNEWARKNIRGTGDSDPLRSAYSQWVRQGGPERMASAQVQQQGGYHPSLAPVMQSIHPLLVEYKSRRSGAVPTYRTIPAPMRPDGSRNTDFDHIGFLNTIGDRDVKITGLFHPNDPGVPKFEGLSPEERTTPEGQAEHKRLAERHDSVYGNPYALSVEVAKPTGRGITRAKRTGLAFESKATPVITPNPSLSPPYIQTQKSIYLGEEAQGKSEKRNFLGIPSEVVSRVTMPQQGEVHPTTHWLLMNVQRGVITQDQAAHIYRQTFSDLHRVPETSTVAPRPHLTKDGKPVADPQAGTTRVTPRTDAQSEYDQGVVYPNSDLEAIDTATAQYSKNMARELTLRRTETRRVETEAQRRAAQTGWHQGPGSRQAGTGTGGTSEREVLAGMPADSYSTSAFEDAGSARSLPKSQEGIVHLRNEALYGSGVEGDESPERIGRLSTDPDIVGAHRVAAWSKAILTGDDAHLDDVHAVEGRLGHDGSPDPYQLPTHPDLEYTIDPGALVAARHLVLDGNRRRRLDNLAAKRLGSAQSLGVEAALQHPVHQDIQATLDGTSQDGKNFLYKLAEQHGVDPNEGHADKILANAHDHIGHLTKFDIGRGQIGVPPEVVAKSNVILGNMTGKPPEAPTKVPRAAKGEIVNDETGEVFNPTSQEAEAMIAEARANKLTGEENSPLVQAVMDRAATRTANAEEHDVYHTQIRGHRRALVQSLLQSGAADTMFSGGRGQREAVVAASSAINATRNRSERGAAATGADLAGVGGVPK